MIASGNESYSWRSSLGVVAERKWTVIAITFLTSATALFVSFVRAPSYEAQAQLLVRSSVDEGEAFSATELDTEIQLIQSDELAGRVIADLNLDVSTGSFLRSLEVSSLRQSEILVISYIASEPRQAAAVANSVASSYIALKQEETRRHLVTASRAIQNRVDKTIRRRLQTQEELQKARSADDEVEVTALKAKREALDTRLSSLQTQLESIEPARVARFAGGEIVDRAEEPSSSSSLDPTRDGSLGAAFGLILGTGVVLLRSGRKDRPLSPVEMERNLGVPVLGRLPKITIESSTTGASAIECQSDALRRLATDFRLLAARDGLRVVLFTSARDRGGTTFAVAHLGAALAKSGAKVALASCNLWDPDLETYFGIESSRGLASWLASEDENLSDVVQEIGTPELTVIPAGHRSQDPEELLTVLRVSAFTDWLRKGYDFSLLDSPSPFSTSDALLLAPHSDGTVVVISEGTPLKFALQAIDEIQEEGGNVVACLLNSVDVRATRDTRRARATPVPESETASGDAVKEAPRRRLLRRLRVGR